MATRLIDPLYQAFDNNGNVGAGFKLYFYETGTTTPKDTFSDEALSVPNTNPVVSDSNGRFTDIFGSSKDIYKVILKDSNDVEKETYDPVDSITYNINSFETRPTQFWGITTGTSAAYKIKPDPSISSYTNDLSFIIEFHITNTSPVTLEVFEEGTETTYLDPKSIKKYDSTGAKINVAANDLNGRKLIIYDGVDFVVLSSFQATETCLGIAEVATQTETDNGTNDDKFITPLKLENSKYTEKKFINSITASDDATIEFTSFIDSSYEAYKIEVYNLIPVTDGTRLQCRVSEDNGSTWKQGASDYDFVNDGRNSTGVAIGNNLSNSDYMEFNAAAVGVRISNSSDAGYYGKFIFENLSGTSNKKIVMGEAVYTTNGTPTTARVDCGGIYKGTTNAVNGIQFFMDSGNISSGKFKLYGLKI